MRKHQQFYICMHCGNMIGMINNTGVPLICCGESMTELIPNTEEASHEKHLPMVTSEHNKVRVQIGSMPHPMEEKHFIEWVYVETSKGGQRKTLAPCESPEVHFSLVDDELIAVYAYCNIHGLWKTQI